MDLTTALRQYTLNPECDNNNYVLAKIYDHLGHTSSALSFYLRCAERTKQLPMAYECLVRLALCLQSQGNREFSYVQQLKHAITVMPDRPEAYFLLCQHLESKREFYDEYMYSCIALKVSDFTDSFLHDEHLYFGKDSLEVCKAVSGVHWDKIEESKAIFTRLANQSKIDYIKTLSRSNLQALGMSPEHC